MLTAEVAIEWCEIVHAVKAGGLSADIVISQEPNATSDSHRFVCTAVVSVTRFCRHPA